jgi:hypothetical protein
MALDNEKKAVAFAEKLAEEMLALLDAEMLAEARAMGIATSVFAAQLEEYREKYKAGVTPALAGKDFFDVAISRRLLE